MKNKLVSILSIIGIISSLYKLIDYYYYKTYNGNDEIVFLDFKGSDKKDYNELFELSELKGKYIYATLNLRGEWDTYRNDLTNMSKLSEKYKNSNLVFLYTVDSVERYNDEYDWKKVIKKYELKGYHINLPNDYETNLWEETLDGKTTITHIPKYMLISNTGRIVDKWAHNPSKFDKLTNKIDSLMNKKRTHNKPQ